MPHSNFRLGQQYEMNFLWPLTQHSTYQTLGEIPVSFWGVSQLYCAKFG